MKLSGVAARTTALKHVWLNVLLWVFLFAICMLLLDAQPPVHARQFANPAPIPDSSINWITPDHVYVPYIKTVHLYPSDMPLNYPLITLNSGQTLTLSFDDLEGGVKDYYYTIVLCNADWKPANLNPFEYIKGFSENRITQYRFSTFPLQHYTHYTLSFPNSNCAPARPGNYILKVYLNDDPSQPVFTRRFLVVNQAVQIAGKIEQPINPKIFQTYQKVNIQIDTRGLNVSNPFDQIKVWMLQNYRWDNAIHDIRPTFVRGSVLEYNAENDCEFPAMKEWRWIDLRSFRLETERVERIDENNNQIEVYARPDASRANQRYQQRRDIDGRYTTEMLESGYNPDVDGDYATVHFSYVTPEPFTNAHLYIFGELTNYECNPSNELHYNPTTGAYEGSLFLKQGYYDYIYGLVTPGSNQLDTRLTEGNWWETENTYTILVYFRPIGGRADELVGATVLNSITNR
ncbi:uncharacterized protein DUF5103 [Thermoflavifilum aggregans]|uniref:Uncharacterized protein DUF5103 n=1 Tax=Thermoflavifilum aggregans TaxID=454188 RepID=A0A2M9CUB2_9BACT|nr:uncharacterized protein DUF5103 [Thermoflavifilum aggregans]